MTELNCAIMTTVGSPWVLATPTSCPITWALSRSTVGPLHRARPALRPSKWGVAIFASLALRPWSSHHVRRRRAWVKAYAQDGHTVIEYGLPARGETFGLRDENIKLRQSFDNTWPVIRQTLRRTHDTINETWHPTANCSCSLPH